MTGAKPPAAVIAAIDFLLKHGATKIDVTTALDGTIRVTGNTVECPAGTTTQIVADSAVTISPLGSVQ
jgi:hypothetical protein